MAPFLGATDTLSVTPVDIQLLDQQHEALFQASAHVEAITGAAEQASTLAEAVQCLYAYAEIHVFDEEQLLQKLGYPRLSAHAAEHAIFLKAIRAWIDRLTEVGHIDPEPVRTARDWLVRHINEADAAYARYLRSLRH